MLLLSLLACFTDSEAPDPSTLDSERAALRAIEVDRLELAARDALDRGALDEAAQAVAAGSHVDEARFAPLRAELDAALPAAPPMLRARATSALYDAAVNPETRAKLRQATEDALVLARYADADELAITRREQSGVDRTMGHAALDALRAEYVVPLDEGVLLAAAAHRLTLITSLQIAPDPEATDFDSAFDALVDLGIEHGLDEEIAVAELTEAAFAAADTWSSPIWPAQIAAWERHHDGVASGVVGVVLDHAEGGVVVDRLVEGGSAWKAGVHKGDRILEIRHEGGTLDLRAPGADGPERAAAALRGPDGIAVPVLVSREGHEKTFALERGTIQERTVSGWRRDGTDWDAFVAPGVAFVHIASFKPHTLDELAAVLPDAPAEALVIDLRGNGGGDLSVTARIIDAFVASGPMLHLEGRLTGDAETDAALLAKRAEGTEASPGDPWEGVPLAVLVDGDSASAAEVLAGALQQSANAKVVGAPTTGKGVSQVLRVDQEHGIALQFTNLLWALPDGRRIHRTDDAAVWGIQPDVRIELTPTERFAVGVLQAQREALAVHADGSPMAYSGPELDPELPALSADPQVRAALDALGR
ncbi:MAG: hypothetical protein H6737_01445 [Alphaproteobacteria bacterium]|nr:hypothetical protein [Alphaproteobacteria bacterium]